MQYTTNTATTRPRPCDVCGCDHVPAHTPNTACVQALKAEVARLRARLADLEKQLSPASADKEQ